MNKDAGEYELFLSERPLLKIAEHHYLPIESRLYNNLIFNSLFHKINRCYDGNVEFLNQFGLMFQSYIEYISSEFCARSNGSYEYIKEFTYGKPRKNSPDVMILHRRNNKTSVLVIEVKSARLLYDMINYQEVSDDTIEKSVNKVISKPILQSIYAMNDVVLKEGHIDLNSSVDYIFITVTMNNFPNKFQFLDAIEGEVDSYKDRLNILTYNAICIEEFELLLQVLEYTSKVSFVDILTHWNYNKEDSLKNILRRFPTQKDKRSKELWLELRERYSIRYDPITELSDECSIRAFDKYLHKNRRVSSLDEIFN